MSKTDRVLAEMSLRDVMDQWINEGVCERQGLSIMMLSGASCQALAICEDVLVLHQPREVSRRSLFPTTPIHQPAASTSRTYTKATKLA